jgi:hypothetical protein
MLHCECELSKRRSAEDREPAILKIASVSNVAPPKIGNTTDEYFQ